MAANLKISWHPCDPNQKVGITVCEWEAKIGPYTVNTYFSHRTHTASISLGPLRTEVNLGMFYDANEQLQHAERWALNIINGIKW